LLDKLQAVHVNPLSKQLKLRQKPLSFKEPLDDEFESANAASGLWGNIKVR
jgi:hypothetical protein